MASFHFAVQILKRRKGHNAIAAAAYRARCELRDERTGEVQDYRRKDGLQHAEILLPEGAAAWLADRERLWNHVEAMERRTDSQLAREVNMALPAELTDAERLTLVREFVREEFVSRGMVADIAWHRPVPEKGDDPRNFHAHILLTLRQATATGLRAVKSRNWNSDILLTGWREDWCHRQNRALERGGHTARVDHRRLDVQRVEALDRGDRTAAAKLDRHPEIHVGPRAQKVAQEQRQARSRSQEQATARPNAGAWRSAKRADKRRRRIDYDRIDRGDRLAFNADRVAGNAGRFQRQVERSQLRAARLRQTEARALKAVRRLDDSLRELAAPQPSAGWRQVFIRAPDTSVQCRVLEDCRVAALNRLRLSRLLLGRIDGILAGLFMVHERTLGRGQMLLRRRQGLARMRIRLPGQSRGRARELPG